MVIVIVVVVVLNILKNKQEMNLILLIDDGKTRIEKFFFGFKTPKQNCTSFCKLLKMRQNHIKKNSMRIKRFKL